MMWGVQSVVFYIVVQRGGDFKFQHGSRGIRRYWFLSGPEWPCGKYYLVCPHWTPSLICPKSSLSQLVLSVSGWMYTTSWCECLNDCCAWLNISTSWLMHTDAGWLMCMMQVWVSSRLIHVTNSCWSWPTSFSSGSTFVFGWFQGCQACIEIPYMNTS